MYHLKGIRFGFPTIKRLGILNHLGTYPVRWNTHLAPEIHFILKGQSAWELACGKPPLRLSGGTFAVIPSGMRHRALDEHGTPAVRLGITLEQFDSLPNTETGTPFLKKDTAALYELLDARAGVVRRMSAPLVTYVREFFKSIGETSLSSASDRLHLRVLAASILDETARALQNDNQPLLPRDNVVTSVCSWINEHCTDPELSPERLVILSGYGRSRFFAIFFEETGMTPRDYIMRARIAKAKQRLSESASITSIAMDCGFPSATAFSTIFRRHTGLSPKAWKTAQANNKTDPQKGQ